jgi:Arf/Sar family protein
MIVKVFLFGIDSAGKTSILNYLKYGTPKPTRPTLSFNLVILNFPGFDLQVWDAPGQQNLRKIWNNGFNRAKFMIFVLDVNDSERYQESLTEFLRVVSDPETKNLPILFLYHKMDSEQAKSNISIAKTTFKKALEDIKGLQTLETSIKNIDSIELIKEAIIQMIKDLNIIQNQ